MSSDTVSEAAPAGLSGQAFTSLFQAVAGLRNWPALLAMLGCTFLGVLASGLLLATTPMLGFLAGLLTFLVWIVAVGTGINAAGLLQMDHARGISPRSIADALVHGLTCIPKLIVLALAFIAVEVAVFVVIAVLLVICRIPVLGPLLFVVVFPLSVVVAGVTIVGLLLCMLLSLPAIWQGASITRALAQTLAIVRSRLVESVLLLVLLGFITFAVGLIVFGVIAAGLVPTLGMSVSIVGFGGFGIESLATMSQGDAHAVAGAIGGALLWAVAASLVGQVYLLGLSLVYLRVTEGLDLTASEEALRAAFDDARRRTSELAEKAGQATRHRDGATAAGAAAAPTVAAPVASGPAPAAAAFEPSATDPFHLGAAEQATRPPSAAPPSDWTPLPPDAESAPPSSVTPASSVTPPSLPSPPSSPSSPSSPAPSATPPSCPQCHAPVAAEDSFCGVCGHRLKQRQEAP